MLYVVLAGARLLLRGKTRFHFCDVKLKQRFQSESGLNLATGRGKTNLPSFHGLVSYPP